MGQERLSGRTAEKEKVEERMSKKLPEIERTPGGDLPRMTLAQRKRANALIRETCCNYENGNCLLLDNRDTHSGCRIAHSQPVGFPVGVGFSTCS